MSLITFPRISKIGAAATVVASLVVGAIALIVLPPKQKPGELITVALGTTYQISPSNVSEQKSEVTAEVTNTLEEKPQAPLVEERVEPREPLILPNATVETAEVVTIAQDVLEEKKPLPYYRPECLEKKEEGVFLPIKSPQGLRPFDAYQSDFNPNLSKTPLTLVISELGANPKIFEQVKSSCPRQVACAFLPDRSLSQSLNNKARELGYETLLMLPMEPMAYPKSDPGPRTLLTNLPKAENLKRFEESLGQFTGYIGVTPYMGNRFARVKRDFEPLLKEVERRGLAYFEPRLIRSKALQIKPEKMLWTKSQYDIERGLSVTKIRDILKRAEKVLAKKQPVIMTIQADAVSLKEIKKWLPSILKKEVILTPLSSMINRLR